MSVKSRQLVAHHSGKPSPSIRTSLEHLSGGLRSPLRDGTKLDDLHAGRPIPNSLFTRDDFNPVAPPSELSDAFAACESIKRKLQEMGTDMERAKARDVPRTVVKKLAPFFRPKVNGAYGPKLPKHISYDPIDPVVIFKNAVPLVHRVLLRDPDGNDGLDLDGIAYIIERLDEAIRLRRHANDIRFDMLEALLLLLVVVFAKAGMGEMA